MSKTSENQSSPKNRTAKIKRPKSAFGPFFQSTDALNYSTNSGKLANSNSYSASMQSNNLNFLKYLSSKNSDSKFSYFSSKDDLHSPGRATVNANSSYIVVKKNFKFVPSCTSSLNAPLFIKNPNNTYTQASFTQHSRNRSHFFNRQR